MADVWVLRYVAEGDYEAEFDTSSRAWRDNLLSWGMYACTTEERVVEALKEWARDNANGYLDEGDEDAVDRLDWIELREDSGAPDERRVELAYKEPDKPGRVLGWASIRKLELDK